MTCVPFASLLWIQPQNQVTMTNVLEIDDTYRTTYMDLTLYIMHVDSCPICAMSQCVHVVDNAAVLL